MGRLLKQIRHLLTGITILPLPLLSIPLDSVFARGDSCLAIEWTPDSVNTRSAWYIDNGSKCTGSDTVYRHADFIAGVPYRSIAYSYGGEDPYYIFREKVASGFLVGSHLCHYNTFGDPSSVIAGTDCSGFVCYVWDVPRMSTGGLAEDSRFQHISKAAIEEGDILVKAGSHTVLVVEKDDSTHFLIWESTSAVNGCRERLIDIGDPAWNPYSALRNPGISVQTSEITKKIDLISSFSVSCEKTRVLLHLNQPSLGYCLLHNASGRRIADLTVNIPSSSIIWHLPTPLSRGMYLLTFVDRHGSRKIMRLPVFR